METNKKKIFTVFLALGALSTVSSPRTDAISQNIIKDSVVSSPKIPLPKSEAEPATSKPLDEKLDTTQMLIKQLKEANDRMEKRASYWKKIALKNSQDANLSINKARYDSLVAAEEREVEMLSKRDSIILPEPCLDFPEVSKETPKPQGWFYKLFHKE